jgi:hypothetical protein
MQVKDFIEDFKREILQLEQDSQLDPGEKQLIAKLKGLDVSSLRSDLKDALSDDEMAILFKIFIRILRLLGVEVL